MVALSIVAQRGPVSRWVADHGLGATVAMAEGDVLTPLQADEVPTVLFVKGGRVVGVGVGLIPERYLLAHAAD